MCSRTPGSDTTTAPATCSPWPGRETRATRSAPSTASTSATRLRRLAGQGHAASPLRSPSPRRDRRRSACCVIPSDVRGITRRSRTWTTRTAAPHSWPMIASSSPVASTARSCWTGARSRSTRPPPRSLVGTRDWDTIQDWKWISGQAGDRVGINLLLLHAADRPRGTATYPRRRRYSDRRRARRGPLRRRLLAERRGRHDRRRERATTRASMERFALFSFEAGERSSSTRPAAPARSTVQTRWCTWSAAGTGATPGCRRPARSQRPAAARGRRRSGRRRRRRRRTARRRSWRA